MGPEVTLCLTHLDSLTRYFPKFLFTFPNVNKNYAKYICHLYGYLFNIFLWNNLTCKLVLIENLYHQEILRLIGQNFLQIQTKIYYKN